MASPPAPPNHTPEPGSPFLTDFRFQRFIGKGGMGSVTLVKSAVTDRLFAVKETLSLGAAAYRTYLRELLTWFDVSSHPGVCPCLFFRTVSDRLYVFTPYVAGGSLQDWIRSGGLYRDGLDAARDRILCIAICIADVLGAIHDGGVVHQDVKPGNILLRADGLPLVTDFGLSRAMSLVNRPEGDPLSVTGAGGTLAYMSPEQFAATSALRRGMPAGRIGVASDQWNLGITILEMFAGSVTWTSGTAASDVLLELKRKECRRRAPLPSIVADVLRRCFEPDPNSRWKSLHEFAEALRDAMKSCAPQSSIPEAYRDVRLKPPADPPPRITREGQTYQDPRSLFREEGPSGKATGVDSPRSRKGHYLADLIAYDDLIRVRRARGAPYAALVETAFQKALIHHQLEDHLGALQILDEALEMAMKHVKDDSIYAELHEAIGIIHDLSGRSSVAIARLEAAVGIYRRVCAGNPTPISRLRLAVSLARFASASAESERSDALSAARESSDLLRNLVEAGEGRSLASLAYSLDVQARLLSKVNAGAALALHEKATQMVLEASKRTGTEYELRLQATIAEHHGTSRASIGDLARAEQLFAGAAEVYDRLLLETNNDQLRSDLARLSHEVAGLRARLQRYPDALAPARQAVVQYGHLVHRFHQTELIPKRADALRTLADCELRIDMVDALAHASEAFNLLRPHRSDPNVAAQFAVASITYARACERHNKIGGCVDLLKDALSILRDCHSAYATPQSAYILAKALADGGTFMNRRDRSQGNRECDEAIELLESNRMHHPNDQSRLDLAIALQDRARVRIRSGLPKSGVDDLCRSVALLTGIVEATRPDLSSELLAAQFQLYELYRSMGRLRESMDVANEANLLAKKHALNLPPGMLARTSVPSESGEA